MNYLLLINLFLSIVSGQNAVPETHKFVKIDFVELLPNQKWLLSQGLEQIVRINFVIEDGYHIQANKPLDDNLIATELKIISQDEIIINEIEFPESVTFHLRNDPNEMLVFHENMDIQLSVYVDKNINSGQYKINGSLKYQACDSLKCYFPRELFFQIPVEIDRKE